MGNSKSTFLASAGFFLALSASAFADASTVTISLWDKGPDKAMVMDMAVGTTMDMAMANMGVKLSTDKVKAGAVTFQVANASEEIIHEMLVVPLKDGMQGPPINATEVKIDEEGAGDLGEVAELDPGKSGSLTLELLPGKYLLTCNIAGHYMNGMWSVLTVE